MATTTTELTALTGTYTLDPAHSRIGFVARHAMVTKVRGAFNDFEGTAVLDGENPTNSSAQVTIQVHSIDTRQQHASRDHRASCRLPLSAVVQHRFECGASPPSVLHAPQGSYGSPTPA